MSDWQNFEAFLAMTGEERQEAVGDLLANVAEPWLGTSEEQLVMGIVGATRYLFDSVAAFQASMEEDDSQQPNRYIMGLYANTYQQGVRNFAALVGLSDMKRSMDKKRGG